MVLPGVWLISASFFLTGLFYRWFLLFALFLYLLFCIILLRGKFVFVIRKGIFPILLASILGIYSSFVLIRDIKGIIPAGSELTLEGVVRSLSIPGAKEILVHGKWIILNGQRIPFPYQIWVKYKGKRKMPEELVGEYVSIPVYFTGKDFLFYPGDYSHKPHWSKFIFRPLYYFREILYYMLRPLSPRSRSIARAVLLGIKDPVFYRIRKSFNRIGAGHILAISGIHLVILTGLVFWFLKIIGISGVVSDLMAFLFVVLYMLMIPESASLFRAGVMLSLFFLSRIFRRNWSIYDILGLTVFAIFLISPQEVFSLGFWMSGLAVFSILLGLSLLSHHSILDLWYVSFVVSLVLAPIVIKFFGCYPLVAWVINPVMILLMTVFLIVLVIYVLSFGLVGKLLIDWIGRAMIGISYLLKRRELPICFAQVDWGLVYLYYLLLLLLVGVVGFSIIRKERYERWI